MAVVQIVAELIEHGGVQTAGVVTAEAHAQGDGVGDGEVHAVLAAAQQVRIVPQGLHGPVAVGALHRHGQVYRQVVPRQELHDLAQTRQRPQGGGQLHGPLGSDALQGLEPLRLLLDDPQGIGAEAVHQTLSRGGPHALEDAAAQIGRHVPGLLRHAALHALRRQLRAVGRVLHPDAGDGHALAGGGAGDAAHHGDRLLLSVHDQRQHRIAIFLVLKDHRLYGALHGTALAHMLTSPARFLSSYKGLSAAAASPAPRRRRRSAAPSAGGPQR